MEVRKDIRPVTYESMRSALLMLKLVAQGEADIRAGRVVTQEKVFSEIRKKREKTKRRGRA